MTPRIPRSGWMNSVPCSRGGASSRVAAKPEVWRGVAAALVLASACGGPSGAAPSAAAETHAVAAYGRIPLSFEANRGQIDPRYGLSLGGKGYALFLTGDQAVIEIRPPQSSTAPGTEPASVLRMNLVGANGDATSNGEKPQTGVTNYFIGNDPKLWHTDIKAYGRVKYRSVYPGVDLVYYGNQRQLEYDFIVAPRRSSQDRAWLRRRAAERGRPWRSGLAGEWR